ncbi:hypothetical protein [Campylobacter fetus]|uniref:hypothetical protein n=1 Tax=Campylobacter fetus TaxID=196 RepID=UPI000FCBB5B9|nr:hypothetical protein [Campylobacter fetus]RUT50989.1 hypothetical protein BWK67_00250 [Campylobacter fetus]RUT51717.1 hypothetical protein BWK51_00250 [Campylobacter fetus]
MIWLTLIGKLKSFWVVGLVIAIAIFLWVKERTISSLTSKNEILEKAKLSLELKLLEVKDINNELVDSLNLISNEYAVSLENMSELYKTKLSSSKFVAKVQRDIDTDKRDENGTAVIFDTVNSIIIKLRSN